MTGERGHGVAVETDDLLAALEHTRVLQLALDVLWGNMPGGLATESVRAAFCEIDERLRKTTLANLRRGGLPRDFLIVRPINPMNPPGPEDIEKVTTALRTLDQLGLLIAL